MLVKYVNRFTPEWLWDARITMWPPRKGEDSYGVPPIDITEEEALQAAKKLKENGINVVMGWFHLRFNHLKIWDKIEMAVKIAVSACHAHGLKFIEHHTATYISGYPKNSNPKVTSFDELRKYWDVDKWVSVDIRTGRRVFRGHEDEWWCVFCMNNPEWRNVYGKYIHNYLKNTGVDGLMHDDLWHGPYWFGCGCKYCRAQFKEIMGYEFPKGEQPKIWENFEHSIWRDWIRYRTISTSEYMAYMRKFLGKDMVLFTCNGGGANSTAAAHDSGYTYEEFARNTSAVFIESIGHYNRNIYLALSPYTRLAYNWKNIALNEKYDLAIGNHFNQPVLDLSYAMSPEEYFFCWALSKSFGSKTIIWERHYTGIKDWKKLYEPLVWESKYQELYRNPKPYANIAVLFSNTTMKLLGMDSNYFINEFAGWCQTLLDEYIPFEVLIEAQLDDPEYLKDYELLILPNAVCLSEQQMKTIKKFIGRGGSLILTHETSLRDETGKKRPDFGLSDVMGINYEKTVTRINLAFFVDALKEKTDLMKGLKGRFPNHGPQVMVNVTDRKKSIVYARIERYDQFANVFSHPAIIETTYGKGKVVYFTPKIGLMHYQEGPYICTEARQSSGKQMDYERSQEGVKYIGKNKQFETCKVEYSSQKVVEPFWVDERIPMYRTLILNTIFTMLPKDRILMKTYDIPRGLLLNIYKVEKGNIVINLLNTLGCNLSPNQIFPRKKLAYPDVADYLPRKSKPMRLDFLIKKVRDVYMISPDFPGKRKLKHIQRGRYHSIEISPSHIKRYTVIVINHLR